MRPKLHDFIAILNHEVRTNVMSLEGFSNVLLKGKYGKLAEKQKKGLYYIQKRVRTIRKILDDITQIIMN